MVHAVRVPAGSYDTIYFVMGEPFVRSGWTVEPGAWLEVPVTVNEWPINHPRPDQVLCRSIEDDKHYKIFKYRDEVDPGEWFDVSLIFGGTFSPDSWRRFAEQLPSIRPPAGPDNTADMNQVLRNIQARR